MTTTKFQEKVQTNPCNHNFFYHIADPLCEKNIHNKVASIALAILLCITIAPLIYYIPYVGYNLVKKLFFNSPIPSQITSRAIDTVRRQSKIDLNNKNPFSSVPNTTDSNSLEKHPLISFPPKNSRIITQQIDNFKTKALQALSTPHQEELVDFSLNDDQKEQLALAKQYLYQVPPDGIQIVRGGINWVIFLNSAPNLVFKYMKNKSDAEKYLKNVSDARDLIKENNLSLLHVPQSEIIELNGTYFIAQQKEDLMSETFRGQKALYNQLWNDPQMEDYMQALSSQLAKFICLMQFSDVKYDNIPLTKQGTVALIDLDRTSALTGLICGNSGKQDGLLNYIPHKHLDKFIDEINKNNDNIIKEENKIKLIDKSKNREKKRQARLQFHKDREISNATQSIALPKQMPNQQKEMAVKCLVNELNYRMKNLETFSVNQTRKVEFNLQHDSKERNVWEQMNAKNENKKIGLYDFKILLKEALEYLQLQGSIYDYKINWNYYTLKVLC